MKKIIKKIANKKKSCSSVLSTMPYKLGLQQLYISIISLSQKEVKQKWRKEEEKSKKIRKKF